MRVVSSALAQARVPQGKHVSQVGRQDTEPAPWITDAALDIFYQMNGPA